MSETYVSDNCHFFPPTLTPRDRLTTLQPQKKSNNTSSRAGPSTGSPSFVTSSQVTLRGAFLYTHVCPLHC